MINLRCNRGKPMETLGRKARNLTGRPHDSSAAKNCSLRPFYVLEIYLLIEKTVTFGIIIVVINFENFALMRD